jgi:hypothetical protein
VYTGLKYKHIVEGGLSMTDTAETGIVWGYADIHPPRERTPAAFLKVDTAT